MTFTAETAEFAENASGLRILSELGVFGGCHGSKSAHAVAVRSRHQAPAEATSIMSLNGGSCETVGQRRMCNRNTGLPGFVTVCTVASPP
jgi:hypothetical protein